MVKFGETLAQQLQIYAARSHIGANLSAVR